MAIANVQRQLKSLKTRFLLILMRTATDHGEIFLHLSIITTVFNFIYINSHSYSSKYIHVALFTCKKGKQRYKKTSHAYLSYIYIHFLSCSIEKDFAIFFSNSIAI